MDEYIIRFCYADIMKITELSNQKICILGFGREGQAMLKAIEKYAQNTDITIADANEKIMIPEGKHSLQLGTGWLRNLEKFDVIIKSPGIPPFPDFDPVKQKITTGTQIFFDTVAGSGVTIIGVTGSKGKSTTSTLIYEILKAAGKEAYLIGNIGAPAIDYVEQAKATVFFVQELSSYQLMDVHTSPQIAVITSFFPEHLDYHGSLAGYMDAKSHIAKFQNKDDIIFFNIASDGAQAIAKMSPAKHIPFAAVDAPAKIEETRLLGEHNLGNIGAAWKVANHLGIDRALCIDVFKKFQGLPHRLQSLGIHHGIEWIDDAISTTPESAIAALDAIGDRVSTIILGGQDRGTNFSELGRRIRQSKVQDVILIGQTGPRIREAIETAGATPAFHLAPDMQTIVTIAKQVTPSGKICLLSTASPSYDMFTNFEEKGDRFANCVR